MAPWAWKTAIAILLLALTWGVFGQTLHHEFVNYDDPLYVFQNPHINRGLTWASVGWAFTHVHSQNWHPLTSISHMLDVQLFGVNAGWHHFVNVLLHGLSAVLLLLLLERMTGALWPSAFVAAVFAVHPLHVESVAWISERKDVLSGLFFMLTLWCYASYTRRHGRWDYLTTAIFFACGLMSKPMLVTTPVVLLLLDYWPLNRTQRTEVGEERSDRRESLAKLVVEKIPLLGLSLGSMVATILAQNFAIGSTDQLPLLWRVTNAIVSYFDYVVQTFWPIDLIPFYVHPENRLETWRLALATVTLIALTVAAWYWRRRHRYLLVGWLWYLVMLVPVIGIIQVGLQGKADRYTYLPQIGLVIALTWLIRDLTASWRMRQWILTPIAVIVIGVLAALAWKQTTHWQDTETLWTYTLRITPDSDVAHTGLGGILYARGRLDEAIEHYREAIRRRSGNGAAQNGLAMALADQQKVDEAIEHWQKAVEIEPDNLLASNSLALMYARRGDEADAIRQWNNTLHFDADDFDANNNLSWLLSTANDPALRNPGRALELAQRATALTHEASPAVYRTLAVAYGENRRFAEGIEAAQHGIRLCEAVGNKSVAADMQHCIDAFKAGKTWCEARGF